MSNINDSIYEVRLTREFSDWLDSLADDVAAAAVAERLLRVRRGLFGDHASVGDRVSELRVHHGAGLRVYFTIRRRAVVIVLAGGDKRTQVRDIRRAKLLERQL
jgi:putative addiction module killer protein